MNLDRMFQAGLTLAVAGCIWALWPVPGAAAYSSINRRHRSAFRRGPYVLIDRGHWNGSSADPRFDGLYDVLASDGYQVSRNRQDFVPELLRGTRVLLVADAMGWKGALQNGFSKVGVDVRLHPRAFAPEEIAAVRDWVVRGGSLLLMADHAPSGEASQALAAAFGARLADCPASDGRTVIWFDREGGLVDDAISAGRAEENEQVTFAMSFGGGDVDGPPGSLAFLKVTPKSVMPAADAACVPSGAQGIAMEAGRGRVVVLTAQLARTEGLAKRAGINDRLTDNRQLVLNIMHWLSRTE
ncbi:MAG TPA: DUF4350 domain-containing protein [Candidatus Sulfopaludibacter sp.]|jgi:hypothetical protein|nr:DUF4350 domain-containing protein [Candidatus Sulfopaludibacter sp.]